MRRLQQGLPLRCDGSWQQHHCCTLLKSNFKGHNPSGQVMTPIASLPQMTIIQFLGAQNTLCVIYLVSLFLFIETDERERGGQEESDTDRHGERERHTDRNQREKERLCMKWGLQVVFEADYTRRAANVFSVYMSVHVVDTDCVFPAAFAALLLRIISPRPAL